MSVEFEAFMTVFEKAASGVQAPSAPPEKVAQEGPVLKKGPPQRQYPTNIKELIQLPKGYERDTAPEVVQSAMRFFGSGLSKQHPGLVALPPSSDRGLDPTKGRDKNQPRFFSSMMPDSNYSVRQAKDPDLARQPTENPLVRAILRIFQGNKKNELRRQPVAAPARGEDRTRRFMDFGGDQG